MLASLERRPPECDANECRPKFLIDKVEISVTPDWILNISLVNSSDHSSALPRNP